VVAAAVVGVHGGEWRESSRVRDNAAVMEEQTMANDIHWLMIFAGLILCIASLGLGAVARAWDARNRARDRQHAELIRTLNELMQQLETPQQQHQRVYGRAP
jgi:hypothetical protein